MESSTTYFKPTYYQFGPDKVTFVIGRTKYDGCLIVSVLTEDGVMKDDLSIILSDSFLHPSDVAYIDTQKYPFAESFLVQNKLAERYKITGFVGWKFYPSYRFLNLDSFMKM